MTNDTYTIDTYTEPTIVDYLDSIIEQANTLRTLVLEGRVTDDIFSDFAESVRDADDTVDALLTMVDGD